MTLHKRNFVIIVIVLAVAGMAIYGLTGPVKPPSTQAEKPATGVLIGNLLPKFQLAGLDGTATSVGVPGKITVLNFWATWCPPCRAEMPELNEFVRQYGSSVDFYAINIQESPEKVTAFLAQGNLIMPVLFDKDGTVAQTFRVSAIPTTLITDKTGVIRFRKAGAVTMSELEKIIKEL